MEHRPPLTESGNSTRKTPLYEAHIALGGRIVEYAGWQLPIQYEGLVAEHLAVRNAAGLFDVSHMGEIRIEGPTRLFLPTGCCQPDCRAAPGQIAYSPMCAPDGSTLDDVLTMCLDDTSVLLVVNAANRDSDVQWIHSLTGPDAPEETRGLEVEVRDESDRYGLLALQGPLAATLLQTIAGDVPAGLGYYRFSQNVLVAGVPCLVSRTGYTGEDGFEIMTPASQIVTVWEALLAARADGNVTLAGTADHAVPCGLGCRDTLRFEAGMPLYGNELSRDITPLEAGLSRFVALDKPVFIGREALAAQAAQPFRRKLVGFELTGRGVARHGYAIYATGQTDPVGHVTTGYHAPSLGIAVGTALVRGDVAEDAEWSVDIRCNRVPIHLRSRFFYKRGR
jgi:aminomethyltransferase